MTRQRYCDYRGCNPWAIGNPSQARSRDYSGVWSLRIRIDTTSRGLVPTTVGLRVSNTPTAQSRQ